MTVFTLWIEHHQPTDKKGIVTHMPVGITQENIHVKTPFGEFFMSMEEIVNHIIQNGEENAEV